MVHQKWAVQIELWEDWYGVGHILVQSEGCICSSPPLIKLPPFSSQWIVLLDIHIDAYFMPKAEIKYLLYWKNILKTSTGGKSYKESLLSQV